MSPISQRLDHPGIYANSTRDIEMLASVILSYDNKDFDMIKNYTYEQDITLKRKPKFAFVRGPVWSYGEQDMQDEITKFVLDSSLDIEELDMLFCR